MVPNTEDLPFCFVEHACSILTLNLSVGQTVPQRSLHLNTMMNKTPLRVSQRNLLPTASLAAKTKCTYVSIRLQRHDIWYWERCCKPHKLLVIMITKSTNCMYGNSFGTAPKSNSRNYRTGHCVFPFIYVYQIHLCKMYESAPLRQIRNKL